MRIAIYSPQFHACRGGVEKFTAWAACGLRDRGHDVSILCNANTRRTDFYPVPDTIRIHEVAAHDKLTILEDLRAVLAAGRPDVVVAVYSDMHLLVCVLAALPLGVPVIASEHAHPTFIEGHTWSRLDRLAALSASAAIHLIDDELPSSLPEELREKTTVIPNPIPPARQPALPGAAMPGFRLIAVGRLDPVKQFDLLIQSFAGLSREFRDWSLEIWGEGPEHPRLAALIRQLRMENAIFLKGFTDNIPQALAAGHCFCMPSRSELFPLALGEAMAHGLPAVGFAAASGVNRLITHGENGFLAAETTADGLATALRPLLASAELRAEMGKKASERIECFHPDHILKNWDDLLQKVAAAGPPSLEPLNDHAAARARFDDYARRDNAQSPESLQKELRKIHRSKTWRWIMALRRLRKRINIFHSIRSRHHHP